MSIVSKKRHLACFLSFFFMFAAISAQSGSAAQDTKNTDETSIILDGTTADGSAPENAGTDDAAKTPSSIWILVRIVLVLALVCAGIYGVVYLLKKSTGGTVGNDPYLRNVASLYFSPNKSVQVVSLGDRAYMVGVTDQAINLLAEVTDRELVDAMNLASDKKNPIPKGTFQNLFSNFFPGANGVMRGSGNGPSPSAGPSSSATANEASFSGTDLLRAQRERLQRASLGEGQGEQPVDRTSGNASGTVNNRGEA